MAPHDQGERQSPGTVAGDAPGAEPPQRKRLGYFGGSFDPPHAAHLRVAQAAAEAFHLDRVLLVPTGRQPLKDAHSSYEDRLAMTRLLCAEDPRLEASEADAPHADGSPNYTFETLEAVQHLYPEAALFSIAGADSFLTLRKWREPDRLLACAEWIVVSRPGFSLDDLSPLMLTPDQLRHVHRLETLEEDISATGLRERLRVGVSCGRMLTPAVTLYIARQRLYHAAVDI